MKTILIVGGTGAQGAAVVRALISTGEYKVVLFTRDRYSTQSKALLGLGNVEIVLNGAENGYDLDAFEVAARTSYGLFINTDGFALGEQAESYWGIRLYETALKAGVKHIVYSGLDDAQSESYYDPKYYVGRYQGKARVQAYIHGQSKPRAAWTIIRSGPYIEMLSEALLPSVDKDGKFSFNLPLDDGAVPFIHLDDFGRYVHWIFSNVTESSGLDIGVATAHITGQDIANAFEATNHKKAVYNNIPASAWNSAAFSKLPDGVDTKVGYRSVQDSSILNQTYGQNFENWWNLYKASAENRGLLTRDYHFLDRILPNRVRSVQEWMEVTDYSGQRLNLLKNSSV